MIRYSCIFCNSKNIKIYFENDIKIPENITMINIPDNINCNFINYNVQICNDCRCIQNKYLTNIDNLYKNSHINPYGSTRKIMTEMFSNLILSNDNIKYIIEIGGGQGELSDILIKKYKNKYSIIDPSYIGPIENRIIIKEYVENINFNNIEGDTLIMSHVFEHFYDPLTIIKMIHNNKNINNVYICHPNFNKYVLEQTYNILTCEHTFYIENEFLIKLFEYYNFELLNTQTVTNYAILFEFRRNDNEQIKKIFPININTEIYFNDYQNKMLKRIKYLNDIIDNTDKIIYIWPCSVHSITLFNFGLNYKKIKALLDNSESKINKYIYGYNIICLSYNEILHNNEDKYIILSGGCFNNELEFNDLFI